MPPRVRKQRGVQLNLPVAGLSMQGVTRSTRMALRERVPCRQPRTATNSRMPLNSTASSSGDT